MGIVLEVVFIVQGVPMGSHMAAGTSREQGSEGCAETWMPSPRIHTGLGLWGETPAPCLKDELRLNQLFRPAIRHWLVETQQEERDLGTGWLCPRLQGYGAAQEAFHH